jgi:hypothetical protein
LRDVSGYTGDLVDHLAKHDEAEEGKKEECHEINRDVFVAQDVVLQGEVHEARNRSEKEKGEAYGQLIIEPLVFHGELIKPLPGIHGACLLLVAGLSITFASHM